MSRIISVHSFRGGTGKSNTVANLAAAVAAGVRRVGIIDTDIQSPGIHVLFGLDEQQVERALNDYLWGRCPIEQAAYDVTPPPVRAAGGRISLIPASMKMGEITRVLREGYDVSLLNDGIRAAIQRLQLDYLFIDTHPGLNEETLLSIAISDVLILLLRPDAQDFQGTAVTVDVARRLSVPRMLMLVNKALPSMDRDALRQQVEQAYGNPVAGIFPLAEEVAQLGSSGIFSLQFPDHPYAATIRQVAAQLVAP
jgi:MinD-like ATPase involved in chromosome partitioning or flagellar assembly